MAARNQDVADDEFAGLDGSSGTDDVGTQTGKLLEVPKQDPAAVYDSVVALAGSLPSLDDVAEVEEGDVSPLTDAEKQQKEETETVIVAASKVGKAAIWVMGQGFAAAKKGQWFRETHPTIEAYMADLVPEVVPRQARRWVTGSTLALAITSRTGTAPVEGQIRELVRAKGKEKKTLPQDIAEDMYVVANEVADTTGAKVTAKVLANFRKKVEETGLPQEVEQRKATLQELALDALAGPIGPEAQDGAAGEPEEAQDDVVEAEIVTPHLDALDKALRTLKTVRKTIKAPTFREAVAEHDPERYSALITDLRTITRELNGVTDRAPGPMDLTVPTQAEHDNAEHLEGSAT
ncbi:hypothetical protein [Streptomyces rugosispiralis]|uniref:Uncharacterized protein n=1 Tax=Streptomyces rugosispiralis TaxID=2967341 RepID=A0ABT1VB97_9ACTN|nr:hypothetical protein [Streptomyces rugosispiralis]MCQ8194681.1 hypothetical protein [Streptomyces rugosispiralis]